ncbi:MAG: GTA-gp10 family protein [Micropepsaceae bacterium]
MANAARGEVALVRGGRRLTLCLTMAALAEIEHVVRGRTMETLTADQMLAILRALLKGGGEIEAANNVEKLDLEPRVAMRAVAAALLLASGA